MTQRGSKGVADSSISLLLVEDEPALRRAYARVLSEAGFSVQQAGDVDHAIAAMALQAFDVVLSDITMPGASGIDLLRKIRERDLDVPVVLVTGNPSLATAMNAVEHGVLRYLVKPVDNDTLVEAAHSAARYSRLARLTREASRLVVEQDRQSGDRAKLEAGLTSALNSLWMAYQPIISYPGREVAGFEALVRTREAAIPTPTALFNVAERLGRVHEVSRAIRANIASMLARLDPGCDIFINLHPRDLMDETLYSQQAPLTRFATRIVLEVTERVALDDPSGASQRVERLRALGFRIAIDNLGAGDPGLSCFAQLAPEVVKIDTALIRGIDGHPAKRKLVGSLAAVCRELGMLVVAEGVETVNERDAIVQLGCDLQQGYLFARPDKPFPTVAW